MDQKRILEGLLSPAGLGKRKKATRIGSFLRAQRERREMTLAQAAAKMPIADDTIRNIESGDIKTPSLPVLRGFARLYGVSFDRLRGMLDKNAMPLENVARNALTARKGFSVFKDAAGRHRWVMVSSSAYEDRDNEIVSTKALANAVAEHDATGERGPLRWWHMPGVEIGATDFGMMLGRMLVESGTFSDENIGGAIAKQTKNLSASIGFKHPKNEPVEGVFDNISIFERSILPKSKASNLFASLSVKGSNTMPEDSIKVREFIELVGPDEAAKFLGQIDQTDKAAEAAQFRFKEADDLSAMSADELLEYSLLLKEHEESEAEKADSGGDRPAHPSPDDERPRRREGGNSDLLARLNKMMGIIEAQGKAIKALQGSSSKEAEQPAPPDALDAFDERLKALEGEQPRAIQAGYRATQQGDPVEDSAVGEIDERDKEWKEAVEANPQIAPFAETAKAFGTATRQAALGHPHWGSAPGVPGPNGLSEAPPINK